MRNFRPEHLVVKGGTEKSKKILMLVREEDKAMENPLQLPESKYNTAA